MIYKAKPITRRNFMGDFAGAAISLSALAAFTPKATFAAELSRPPVQFVSLAEGVWRHISYCGDPGAYWPSNGLVILHRDKALLIDTPCTAEDTEALLSRIKGVRHMELIITHAHGDRMAGIEVTRARGIPSFAYEASLSTAIKRDLGTIDRGWPGPVYRFSFGGRPIELYYPGPAHTADNTVLYLKDSRLLYGACMVRALAATNPGGLESADLCRWPQSLQNLKNRYKNARIVVPGHGDPGDLRLLDHTADLVEAARKEAGNPAC